MAVDHEVLARVDLDLQAEPPHRRNLGGEAIDERGGGRRPLPTRFAEQWIEPLPEAVEHISYRTSLDLHEVDVFGIPARRRQHDLVDRGPAPEGEYLGQLSIREDLDERPGENEILLDHPVVRPWRHLPPGDDVGLWDHAVASTSNSSFTATRQRASRGAAVIATPGESGVSRGARTSTHSAKARATS